METRLDYFSLCVKEILVNNRKPPTRASYNNRWRKCLSYIADFLDNTSVSPLLMVLYFLVTSLDKELNYSSVRVCLAAISMYHPRVEGFTVFSQPDSKMFLKGLLQMYPLMRQPTRPWKLPLMLSSVIQRLFDPMTILLPGKHCF